MSHAPITEQEYETAKTEIAKHIATLRKVLSPLAVRTVLLDLAEEAEAKL